ncbi:hypothetical protein [Streptomyces liangshanensis]|uniref:hypothetical protein n=1 Tax=Streptomyces liangshanensis TaxID=2717324 RepID=UPI0036D9E279
MRRIRTTVSALAMSLLAVTLTVGGANASTGSGGTQEVRSGVERIDLGNGVTMLRGVKSQAQLAASCASGQFCGYSSQAGYGLSWGCGSTGISWSGGGWWYNNLTGTRKKVAMFGSGGNRIYTTPNAPSQDTTANWTPVYSLLVCVA